jgi:acetyl/propionyl-CoA carboxylase alpha subunit
MSRGLLPAISATRGSIWKRFVASARHIEVQIFGDGKGRILTLGERDCSTQRRNQKVVEETPAPNLSDTVRARLRADAVALGQAVNYESAGTVEFVYDVEREAAYFLEVNTRLQVEHPVTEEVFGVDLVEWMIRQAAGDSHAGAGNIEAARSCHRSAPLCRRSRAGVPPIDWIGDGVVVRIRCAG